MLIGITGTDGAGKGTVVDYLVRKHGFVHYSARELLLEEIKKRGQEVTRNNLRLTANALRKEHGDDVIVRIGIDRMEAEGADKAIIESIRALAEETTLKAEGGILLAVDADPKTRYQRISGRKSASDLVSFEEFTKQENLEMNDSDPHGMQKAKVMQAADFTIKNNASTKVLGEAIEDFLKAVNPTEIS